VTDMAKSEHRVEWESEEPLSEGTASSVGIGEPQVY
jgi:hypothetical protein